MAGSVRIFSFAYKNTPRYVTKYPIRWQTTAHSLIVRQRIQDKKKQALLGGGEKRIEAQHRKVATAYWLLLLLLLLLLVTVLVTHLVKIRTLC